MAITNGYCTLAQLRSAPALNLPSTYTTDDTLLESIITAASRAIDKQCGRFFYKSSAHEVKYFTADNSHYIDVGDLVSVTALYTDDDGARTYPNTWATTDYDLTPFAAASLSEPEPYLQIECTPLGNYNFPVISKGVKLDAVFGWPAVPSVITQVCILWSARLYKRLATPLGVQGVSTIGTITMKIPIDPDLVKSLAYYTVMV